MELVVGGLLGFMERVMGHHAKAHLPVIGGMVLFIVGGKPAGDHSRLVLADRQYQHHSRLCYHDFSVLSVHRFSTSWCWPISNTLPGPCGG